MSGRAHDRGGTTSRSAVGAPDGRALRTAALGAVLAAAAVLPGGAAAQGQVTLGPGGAPFPTGIFGRVCWDEDGDGRCSEDERGVAGARVVLEDGTASSTDDAGRFHIAAAPPRTLAIGDGLPRAAYGRHVAKVDLRAFGASLPAALVELAPGGVSEVDFAVPAPARVAPPPLAPLPGGAAAFEGELLLHPLSGVTGPGHRILLSTGAGTVAGADGRFQLTVSLRPGATRLLLLDVAPDGGAALFGQRLFRAVRAEGGDLVIPEPPARLATLRLPRPGAAVEEPLLLVPLWAEVPLKISGVLTAAATPGARTDLAFPVFAGTPLVLRVEAPSGAALELSLPTTTAGGFGAGLLDLELSLGDDGVIFYGRGAANGERELGGGFRLRGGVELDDRDATLVRDGEARSLAGPREAGTIERVLVPERELAEWADDSVTADANPGDGRLHGELLHERYGSVRAGTLRAGLTGREVGRYDRPLFGAAVDARLPEAPGTETRAYGFGSVAAGAGFGGVPAHDELWATGGSLLFLRNADVIPGSERVLVSTRDALSGLPIEERELRRGEDYELEPFTGRLLLARPLGSLAGSPLLTLRPGAGNRQLVIVDYLHVPRAPEEGEGVGGARLSQRVGLGAGELTLGGHGVRENGGGGYTLLSGDASLSLFEKLVVRGEYARSEGALLGAGPGSGFASSGDGGLHWVSPVTDAGEGEALRAEARLGDRADGVEGFARLRSAGFSDGAALGALDSSWYGGSAWTSGGAVDARLRGDLREGEDPRAPGARRDGKEATASVSRRVGDFTPRLEALFQQATVEQPAAADGSHLSAGAGLDYHLTSELTLRAGHLQTVLTDGSGPGAEPDTFTGGGVSWAEAGSTLSVLGGAGPRGPEAGVSYSEEEEGTLRYGTTTVDVDAPDAIGARGRAASGARQRVSDLTEVYAEDAFTRDLDGARASRTVGIDVRPARPLQLSARYERAFLAGPLEGEPLLRDAGGAGIAWTVSGVRLALRGELGRDRGDDPLTLAGVDRRRALATASASLRPARWLGLTGRATWARIAQAGEVEAESRELGAGAAIRHAPYFLGLRYSRIEEVPPPERALDVPYTLHLASVVPAVALGPWFALGLAGHAGLLRTEGGKSDAFSAALRPVVRPWEGLELAGEYARRDTAPAEESLEAGRVEVGYRFTEGLLLALGYNLFGFVGNGVDPREEGRTDRLYLRAEAWF